MWAKLKTFAPVAFAAGYAVPYMSKGWDRILVDLQSITVDKLMSKWQNFAVAAGCGAGIYFLGKSKLPQPIKVIALIALWGVAGYQIGLAVDPPFRRGGQGQVRYVAPRTNNQYSAGSR